MFMPINTHDERGTVLVSVEFEDVIDGKIEAAGTLQEVYRDDFLPSDIWPAGRETCEAWFTFQRVVVRDRPPTLWECLCMWWSMRKMFTRKKEET